MHKTLHKTQIPMHLRTLTKIREIAVSKPVLHIILCTTSASTYTTLLEGVNPIRFKLQGSNSSIHAERTLSEATDHSVLTSLCNKQPTLVFFLTTVTPVT